MTILPYNILRSETRSHSKIMPTVLVYRDHLFALSETFIYRPYTYIEHFTPVYFGSKRASPAGQYDIPRNRFLTLQENGKSLQEALFKLLGRLPDPVVSWIRQHRPHLIHAHFAPDGVLALPLARKFRIPLVVSLLGTDITLKEKIGLLHPGSWHTYKLYVLRKRQLQTVARAFLVPSRFLLQKALERGYPEEKLRWLPHGVDTNFFHPDPNAVQRYRILFVGRLIPLKGLRYLLGAVRRLLPDFPSLKVVVIGDGPERASSEAWAEAHLPGVVEFRGAAPPEVVSREMQKAWVFVLPSVSMPTGQAESFGMVFLEAQASGCPIVAFRTGGIPEVVQDSVTGFLAPERDEEALTRLLRSILEEPNLRFRMGEAARRWVEQQFDIRKVARRLEALYAEILASRETT